MRIFLLSLILVNLLGAEQQRVYFGTAADGIYTALLNKETGVLSSAEMAAPLPRPGFLARKGHYLYAASSQFGKDGGLASYRVEEDGSLSLLNEKPSGGAGCCHVSLDISGQFLLFSNYSGGSSGCIELLEDGSLSDKVSILKHEGSSIIEARQQAPHPHSSYIGPDNTYVYTPDLGTDEVWTSVLNKQTGALNLINKASHPKGRGPRHMKCHSQGKHVYVLSELTLQTELYDRSPESGILTHRQSFNNKSIEKDISEMSCSEIKFSLDERFIYVANRDLRNDKRDSLSVFSVRSDGALDLVQEVEAQVWIPRHINLSPDGKWLLVAGKKSNAVVVFSIDVETGLLSYSGNEVSIPKPMCVEF